MHYKLNSQVKFAPAIFIYLFIVVCLCVCVAWLTRRLMLFWECKYWSCLKGAGEDKMMNVWWWSATSLHQNFPLGPTAPKSLRASLIHAKGGCTRGHHATLSSAGQIPKDAPQIYSLKQSVLPSNDTAVKAVGNKCMHIYTNQTPLLFLIRVQYQSLLGVSG